MKVNEILTESVSLEQLTEEFDLIESIIERLAAHNGVDAEVIWEDLETLTEDELYAFAVTSEPIMESQGVAEDLTRRGFLKGAGAAAVAGAAGGTTTKANAQQITQWVKYATDLAVKTTLGRLHQDTGYDLRNWVATNVGNWVNGYCAQTNSYNAKNVIDYCNQQGLSASGLDKQNALVTALLTNMKDRCQDFLNAYRASINEKFQEFNQEVQKQQSSQQSSQQQKQAMGGLNPDEFDIVIEAVMLYALSKDADPSGAMGPMHKDVAAALGRFIRAYNNKDYVNSLYSKMKQSLEQVKQNQTIYLKELERAAAKSQRTVANLDRITANKEPEFKEGMVESEAWQKANNRDKTDGMSRKAVNTYRREHPGSKLQTAVTTKPSKLKKGSKASKRRKSYCSRSRGQMKMHSISCSKTPDKAICKARRRWNC